MKPVIADEIGQIRDIPVMRPRLPRYEKLAQYLKQIDENRTYTNYGPLQELLTSRLAEYFGVKHDQVLLLANGTLALQGAIEVATWASSSWVVPSWTFVASAEAVCNAQREIVFGDVDPLTWELQPSKEQSRLAHMVVAPFGSAPKINIWRDTLSDVPLLIDAASCFDACRSLETTEFSHTAVMVSLHATKLVTTGEGGALIGDADWLSDVRQWSNFGFRGKRVADVRGTNAKLSEYAAAIGLASLDEWDENRRTMQHLTGTYSDALASLNLSVQPAVKDGFVTSTLVAIFGDKRVRDATRASLEANGVSTRAWWADGVHRMAPFANCSQREQLHVTEHLASVTLGLPFFVDMTEAQLAAVVSIVESILN